MTIKQNDVIAEGIVLKSMPYKENDALVTVYFREYGKMTLICKGVKKVKSKNAAGVSTLTKSHIQFIARQGLSTLIKAEGDDFYRYIKEDVELEAYASYFMEFVLKNEEDNQPDSEVYDMLEESLNKLNQGYDSRLVYLLFSSFILKHIGSPLYVDGCVRCDSQRFMVALSLQDGGFICKDCFDYRDLKLDGAILKAFRHINKASLENIDALHIDEQYYGKLMDIMNHYVDEYSGLILKSRKFIQQLTKFS